MVDRKAPRLTDPEVVEKLTAMENTLIRMRELAESIQANMKTAEIHRQRARNLRDALNS